MKEISAIDELINALKLARRWMPNSRCPTLNEEDAYRKIDSAIRRSELIKKAIEAHLEYAKPQQEAATGG